MKPDRWPLWFAVLCAVIMALVWLWVRPTAPWRVEAAIAERCLPPLDLPGAIRSCLDHFVRSPQTNPWDRPGPYSHERQLFDCMQVVGYRASGRPWGVPMGACAVSVMRTITPDDPYSLVPPCPEEECGMAAQVRVVGLWKARFCHALSPELEGGPPGCG